MISFSLNLNRPHLEQLPQLVELDQLCLGGLWTLAGYQRELNSPNSHFWVLSTPAQMIGCGCFWAILEEAHITLLMVHPDYQHQGLGQLLLLTLLNDAVSCQLERVTLEVSTANQTAQSLYQKFGFKVAGRRKNYYPKTGEDALILWRGDLHYPQFKTQLLTWQTEINAKLSSHSWQVLATELGF